MRHLAGAVSVITVGEREDRTGFTATSVSSLSADVPSVIVSVNRTSSSWPALEKYRRFCVNVLAADQQHVAQSFAGFGGRKGVERYGDAQWYQPQDRRGRPQECADGSRLRARNGHSTIIRMPS
jgi:flavin reductase (DIM6/NTAB) family NADH-FMN oxidoreductase RutF